MLPLTDLLALIVISSMTGLCATAVLDNLSKNQAEWQVRLNQLVGIAVSVITIIYLVNMVS